MPSSIAKALKELPTSLDDTYERALQGIPREKRQHAQRLFQCLVAAVRPLSVEELAEVFAIQFDSDAGPNAGPTLKGDWRPENPEQALLSTCSTLIAVIENPGSKVVQFSHFSVKEYLTSERLRDTKVIDIPKYYIPTDAAHAVLAQACLTVLLQLDDKVDKAALATFPLISYAAQHWADHARTEDVERQIEDPLTRLFNLKRPHLRALLWINDVDSDTKRPIENLDGHPSPKLEATPLYYAALCGLSWLSKYLITSRSEDVNAKCGRHGSPLHAASHKGHVAVVRVLLDNRAGVNAPNRYRKTPMSLAYDGKHTEVVELLLERGASVEGWFDHRGRLLHRASADGRVEVVKLLLRRKADVNAKGDMQWTPLHFAASHGHVEIARMLVDRKANVNAIVRDHGTPTHLAARRGHIEIVQLLLDNGADVQIRADDNKTPLETATSSGHKMIADLLQQYGAKGD
jgi:Ankyrin repeats (3 copies)